VDQLVQLLASLLVLAAFLGGQRGALHPTSRAYLALNLAGSTVLALLAALGAQWGFLLLESVWAAVSAAGLFRHAGRRRRPRAT
jgi:hypothetical protein